jgi:hypothetical protein
MPLNGARLDDSASVDSRVCARKKAAEERRGHTGSGRRTAASGFGPTGSFGACSATKENDLYSRFR